MLMRRVELVVRWLGGIGGVRGTVRDCGGGREEVEGCGVYLVCVLCVLGSVRGGWFVQE